MRTPFYIRYIIISLICMTACRKNTEIETYSVQSNAIENSTVYDRLYVLNEGNMNENRATLDYMQFNAGTYYANIYQTVNPSATLMLGDVGNDLKIYGTKMYAVINMSNKIEVMDAATAKTIGKTELLNCRNITFADGYAYVTAYNRNLPGSVAGDQQDARGIVAKIDTATLSIVDTVTVGRQPDGLDVANGKLYVACSGGYNVLNYDRVVSVIDLSTFEKKYDIDVAINLNEVHADSRGQVFVSSRGDYYQIAPKLYQINSSSDVVVDSFDIQPSRFIIDADTAYIIANNYNWTSGAGAFSFIKFSTVTGKIVSDHFITDSTDGQMQTPYGILVNPFSRNIYITDALDYQTSGYVYAFTPDGKKIWQFNAGQIPAHLTLFNKN